MKTTEEVTEQAFAVIDSRYPLPPNGPLVVREIFTYQRKPMTHEERAAVIIEDLNTYNKMNPVAWLAEVLRSFEREIRNEYQNNAKPLRAAAVQIPDGEE